MNQVLCYGDIVFLNVFTGNKENQSIQEDLSQEINGFLSSQGFFDESLQVQFLTSSKRAKQESINRVFKENMSFDYKICLFKVLPELSFTYFKEKTKTEERIAQIKAKLSNFDNSYDQVDQALKEEHRKSLSISQRTEEAKRQLLSLLGNELERLEKIELNYELEQKDNDLKIKEFSGKSVSYKDQIILQHYISEFYVVVSNKNNQKNTLNKKAALSPFLSKNVLLNLKPRFKYRTLDSFIHYNDEIVVCSLKKEFSLKYYQDKVNEEDDKRFQFLLRNKIVKTKRTHTNYKCLFSNETPCIWKIIFFNQDKIADEKVFGGDFVRILHLNNEEYLQADLTYGNFENMREEVFVPKKLNDKVPTASSVWELNHFSKNENLSIPFVCHNLNVGKKGLNSEIFLKSFLLERMVSCDQQYCCYLNSDISDYQQKQFTTRNYEESSQEMDLNQSISQNKKVSIDDEDEFDKYETINLNDDNFINLRFNFLSILQNQSELKHQNAYYLHTDFGYLERSTNTIEPFWEKKEASQHPTLKNKKEQYFWFMYKMLINKNAEINHLEKEKNFHPFGQDKDFKRYTTQFNKKASAENTFLIEKLSKNEIREIYFLKCFYYYIFKLRQKISQKVELKRIDCVKLTQHMKQFSTFLFENPNKEEIGVKKTQKINSFRQSLLREFLIMETLTDILHICHFENDIFSTPTQLNQWIFLEEISKIINKNIILIISNNEKNVQHCSQWFEMFVKLTIKFSKFGLNLDVELILMQLLKDNIFLIKNIISKTSIEKFVQLLIKYKRFQHIKILKNIIKCRQRVIYKNQREVTILLLKDDEKKKKFLFSIKHYGEKDYRLNLPLLGWEDLNPNAFFATKSPVVQEQFSFFNESIRLLEHLCKQRNYLAINMIRDQFQFKLLMDFINFLDENCGELKISFIRLLINIYIDVYNFSSQQYHSSFRFLKKQNQEKKSGEVKEIEHFRLGFKKSSHSLINSSNSDLSILQKQEEVFPKSLRALKFSDASIDDNEQESKDQWISEQITQMNIFIETQFKKILKGLSQNDQQLTSLIKFVNETLKLLKVLLKTEIIQDKNLPKYYELVIEVILEMGRLNKFSDQCCLRNRVDDECLKDYSLNSKILFCKLIKIFIYKSFKNQISKIYSLNKNNFRKEIIFETLFQKEQNGENSFINKEQLMDIFSNFIIMNRNHEGKLTQTALNTIYFLNSKFKFMELDFQEGIFIKAENEHLYQYLERFSQKLEKIAENCQKWLIVDSHNEILELKNHMVDLFGILLRTIKENTKIVDFNPEIEIDGSDLLQLKRFQNKSFILYYVQIFFEKTTTETFRFVQQLCTALPILKSFFTILDWSYKFRHFGNLRFKEDSWMMYLLISILCHNNEQAIDFVVKNYEWLLLDLYERQEDFCIVFYNYSWSEKHFLQKIINKSNSLYNFFYVILKRCSEVNANNMYKSFNFNILTQILASEKMQANERVFTNIQLYIFLNLKKYYNIKNLLRNSKQIEEQSKQIGQNVKVHNINCVMVPSDLSLTTSILLLIKKFAIGDNKLTKSVCQGFYSIGGIAKILRSQKIDLFFKCEIVDFLNVVYLYNENTNAFNFKEVINNIWAQAITILEENLTFLFGKEQKMSLQQEEEESTFIMLPTTFKSRREYRLQYITNLLRSIQLIILKQLDTPISQIDNLTFYSGLIDFLNLQTLIVDRNIFSSQYREIIKILKDNWRQGKHQKEKIIEQTLIKMELPNESDPEQISPKTEIIPMMPWRISTRGMTFFGKAKKDNRNSRNINSIQWLQQKIIEEKEEIFSFLFSLYKEKPEEFSSFSQNIIFYLDKEKTQTAKIENPTAALSIFRKFVEDIHPQKLSCLDWSEDFFDSYTEEIQMRQNTLIKLNIIELIVNNIKNYSQDLSVFKETLLLAIAILYGGNKNAQEVFYGLFSNNKENKFMQILRTKFDICFEFIKQKFETISLLYIKEFLRNGGGDLQKPLQKVMQLDEWQKRIQITEMIFRFLQLLCEGHNQVFQSYLREQFAEDDFRRSNNINFVEIAAQSFGLIVKYLNPQILSLGEHILDFIIESVQGPCVLNQKQLYKSKIIDYCNDMFTEFNLPYRMKVQGFYHQEKNRKLNSLVVKAVRLLNSLVEANFDENLVGSLTSILHCQFLINHLTKGFLEFVKEIPKFEKHFKIYERIEGDWEQDFLQREQSNDKEGITAFSRSRFLNIIRFSKFNSDICCLFEIYFLIRFISSWNPKVNSILKKLTENFALAFQFFKSFTGSVEIVYQNKILSFYFVIHPCCFYIEKKQLNQLLRMIKRDTPKDKVKDIIGFSNDIYLVMEHRCLMHYIFSKFGINLGFYSLIDVAITCVGVAINIIMIIFFKKKIEYSIGVEDDYFNHKNIVFICFGYTLFILSLFRLYLWSLIEGTVEIKKFQHSLMKRLKREIHSYKLKDEMSLNNATQEQKKLSQINTNAFSNKKYDIFKLLKVYLKLQNRELIPARAYYYLKLAKFFIREKEFINLLTFLCFCIFAVFFDYTFLYSLFLLDIVHHFTILQNLIYAFTKNSTQLFMTGFLALLVTYFYSVFAFVHLNPDFYQQDLAENICSTIPHCFLSILSLGPRSTGSIGDVILDISYQEKMHFFIRWFFDFTIWALVNLILLNVIFGVMIDTFAEIRDQNKQVDDDLENKCVICSIERSILEKYSLGFKNHTQQEHNLYHYLYFIYYLNNKEKTELTGLESYIQEQLVQNEVDWVPILKAKNLDRKIILADEDNNEKLVDEFLRKFKEFEQEIEKFVNN